VRRPRAAKASAIRPTHRGRKPLSLRRDVRLLDDLERLDIEQRRIRAGRPTSNGHVERLQQTILKECWRPSFVRSLVPKLTALANDLEHYLVYYNFDRAHTGRLTKGRIPGEIVYGARKTKATR
jgi:transposase InsO family protein